MALKEARLTQTTDKFDALDRQRMLLEQSGLAPKAYHGTPLKPDPTITVTEAEPVNFEPFRFDYSGLRKPSNPLEVSFRIGFFANDELNDASLQKLWLSDAAEKGLSVNISAEKASFLYGGLSCTNLEKHQPRGEFTQLALTLARMRCPDSRIFDVPFVVKEFVKYANDSHIGVTLAASLANRIAEKRLSLAEVKRLLPPGAPASARLLEYLEEHIETQGRACQNETCHYVADLARGMKAFRTAVQTHRKQVGTLHLDWLANWNMDYAENVAGLLARQAPGLSDAVVTRTFTREERLTVSLGRKHWSIELRASRSRDSHKLVNFLNAIAEQNQSTHRFAVLQTSADYKYTFFVAGTAAELEAARSLGQFPEFYTSSTQEP